MNKPYNMNEIRGSIEMALSERIKNQKWLLIKLKSANDNSLSERIERLEARYNTSKEALSYIKETMK